MHQQHAAQVKAAEKRSIHVHEAALRRRPSQRRYLGTAQVEALQIFPPAAQVQGPALRGLLWVGWKFAVEQLQWLDWYLWGLQTCGRVLWRSYRQNAAAASSNVAADWQCAVESVARGLLAQIGQAAP